MSKPLDQVTDEDLLRNGLADFTLRPRQIMPWRTENERLTGVPPTDEERQHLVDTYSDEAIELRYQQRTQPGRFHPHYGRF
ncbi:hypothetical protein EVB78_163 [Rhizobium phage RHph_N1_15]|nr:hypothetical protein EVB77_163 [Rhizobium phage RHph_N1_10]QIG69365.1 hypothetical protein EVB78_163 [Rhizobium phage RHph_N1_15]QIG75225.1 hypothetical protein EVC15_163 [Rhizobium phage RHph_N2_6]